MIHAYNENYLLLAQNQLAIFLDYSVNYLKHSLKDVYDKFLESNLSDRFMNGDPTIIAGRSGIELAYDVFGYENDNKIEYLSINKTIEFWLGYSLAYFQWYTCLNLNMLNKYVSILEIKEMYDPYHEMDIMKFVERLLDIYNQRKNKTNLEIRRHELKLSRNDLANISGVPYRVIEHYEQRVVDINKAGAMYILSLANALYIDPKDLLETTI